MARHRADAGKPRALRPLAQLEQPMKILMVLTSHDQLGNTGRKTGFWLEEFAAPYFVFRDAGVELTLASPRGGQPPLDPKSDLPENQTPPMARFKKDKTAQEALANTVQRLERRSKARRIPPAKSQSSDRCRPIDHGTSAPSVFSLLLLPAMRTTKRSRLPGEKRVRRSSLRDD